VEAYYRPIGFQEFESPTLAHEGDKVVNHTQAAFTLQQISWFEFFVEAESTPGP